MGILSGTPNSRQNVDARLQSVTALGTAASTVQSAPFDLGDFRDGILPEEMVLAIVVPPTPALTSGASLTFSVLADSAATPTTAAAGSPTFSVTGTAGGGAGQVFTCRLPSNCPEFVAVKALSGTSGAGNNSGVSFTTQLQF